MQIGKIDHNTTQALVEDSIGARADDSGPDPTTAVIAALAAGLHLARDLGIKAAERAGRRQLPAPCV
jgi:hypothetical protein